MLSKDPIIRIGNRAIGENRPTYIIAEIGINHNGDPDMAMKLIDVAKEARVDAVKFQKRDLASLYLEEVLSDTVTFEQNFQYMIPVLKQVELTENEITGLKKYCDEIGLEFLCTPFDTPSLEFLATLEVKAFKIASADLNNLELLGRAAEKGKPMLISTGMSYWEEIEKSVKLLKEKNVPFALLHCRSVYPVWPREVNLKMINKLRRFKCPVGYSGHDIGIVIPLVAASMGASIIEKHITLDKSLNGPDHKISLMPEELKRLVRDIRIADQAMGRDKRYLLRGEILNRELFGKSLTASKDIKTGTLITRDMIEVKGPGKGLSPGRMDELTGKTIRRTLLKGEFFIEEDLDSPDTFEFNHSFYGKWGLIARFRDFEDILKYQPKTIEFHLAEKDLDCGFEADRSYSQELIVHVPEYMGDRLNDLCSSDDQIREESIDQVQRTIALSRTMARHFKGKPKIIAHPGAMSLNVKLDRQPLKDALLKSLQEIETKGFDFLLENLPPYPWYFGGQWKGNYFMDADDIKKFCEDTGIRICFDLSHAALYCNAKEKSLVEYIETVFPYIAHIHFADAYGLDGEGVQIGEGDIDFDTIMPFFTHSKTSWVPEIWRGHLQNGKGFVKALKMLHEFGL